MQNENYLPAYQHYIDLKPVRAAMVEHPGESPWSSYHANAQGERPGLQSHHPLYLSLSRGNEVWQGPYRELFRCGLDPGLMEQTRKATN